MYDEEWTYKLKDGVFTYISNLAKSLCTSKYPTINFTSQGQNGITVFPTVYIHTISGNEIGRTNECNEIEGINYAVQVDVSHNGKMSDCEYIMKKVSSVFKMRGFNAGFPIQNNPYGNVKVMTARFTKNIGIEEYENYYKGTT